LFTSEIKHKHMKHYQSEFDGQKEFYERVSINPDLSHYTDGLDRGNLYENKLDISNIYKVLFQAIKYASRIRIRGEKLPANLILNDLNKEVAYIFKSKDLLQDIEKIYFGAASRGNDEYKTEAPYKTVDYSTPNGLLELLTYVNSEEFVKYHVNSSNIVGLSQQYYKSNPDKDAFINGDKAEIRHPKVLSDRIIPYAKKNNMEFKGIMDCLNPGLLQREQGAYYTPPAYVAEMQKNLIQAVKEVPSGMDYVVIDRCAGTGNLEDGLPEEILGHCILSTIEFNEYVILNYKYGDKCQVVIPNTDALAYDIIPAEQDGGKITNDYVREKVNDDNCVVILMENPPYSEVAAGSVQKTGKKENLWKKSWVYSQMEIECSGVVLNDLTNLFIWSGFKYYLRKQEDSYILFSPTKYWRTQGLADKVFRAGFLCNRKEFHADQGSAIGCIWWQNIEDTKTESLSLTPYDIVSNSAQRAADDITIRKAYKNFTSAFDNRRFKNDAKGIICERDGREFENDGRKSYIDPIFNKNIVAYLCVSNFQIDRKDVVLTRCGLYKAHGFYVRSDNFVEKLPLFVAATFPYDKWYKTDIYSKSLDGGDAYLKDKDFLKKCLIYTSLTPKNKCRSLKGSDKKYYVNELCFDGEKTLAKKALRDYEKNGFPLDDQEKNLLKYWEDVLYEARKTTEYQEIMKNNPKCTFGLWQIKEEINIRIDSGRVSKTGKPIMTQKYPPLNSEITKLENELKKYYSQELLPKVFSYQLIK